MKDDRQFRYWLWFLAVAGVTLVFTAAILIPTLLRSRIVDYPGPDSALRNINTGQWQYKTGVVGSRYGTLATLSGTGNPAYLDLVIGSGTKYGYTFVITVGPGGQAYSIRAGPSELNVTGTLYYFTSEGGVIFAATDPGVDSQSSPID